MRRCFWRSACSRPIGPLWLASRGLDAGQIGLVLALMTWAKVGAAPLAAGIADRLGVRRPVMLCLAAAALAVFVFNSGAGGFATLALGGMALGMCFSPLIPLGENLTMLAARARRFDYGRVRLWGSLAFIVGAWGGGALIGNENPAAVPQLMIGAAVMIILACANLPDVRATRAAGSFTGLGTLLRRPSFLVFLATASLIQSSHAAYYGFVTLHWHAAGLDAFTIGALWAEGVVAEIILFAVSGRIVQRTGVAPLFVIAALAGVVRWAVVGTTGSLTALILVQALHAGTFGASHLAAVHYIQRTVPAELSATAQALYAAISMGAFLALATLAAGWLYDARPAGAFWAMAGLCAAGGLAALLLARLSRPGIRAPPVP